MCLGLLLGIEPAGGAVDYGCGAGTLAIAAAKLGWSPVSGVDREERAIEEARENARRNGVEAASRTRTSRRPSRDPRAAAGQRPAAGRRTAAAAVTPQVRHVIVSGIVEGELKGSRDVRRRGLFAQQGMAAEAWIAVRLGREDG